MNNTLRLSLLYLFLIIPQHGNSPIPRMDSWIEMDQGDDFVDRDLTSSLIRTESFGSAHRNYKNALIRKKQTDDKDETTLEGSPEKYLRSFTNHVQRNLLSENQVPNVNYEHCKYIAEDEPKHRSYGVPCAVGIDRRNYRMKISPKSEGRFNNKLREGKYASEKFSGNELLLKRSEDDNNTPSVSASDRRRKCAIRDTVVISRPENEAIELFKLGSGYNGEVAGDNERRRIGNEESSKSLREVKNNLRPENVENNQLRDKKERLTKFDRDEEYPDMEDNEYYNEAKNFASVGMGSSDIADIDYRRINSRGTIYKREGSKRTNSKWADKWKRSDGGPVEFEIRKNKPVKESGSENALESVSSRGKMKGKHHQENQGVDAKTNSNKVSGEEGDTTRFSGTPAEEVEVRSRKSNIEPRFNNDKTDGYAQEKNLDIEEDNRNKREDEDEQKNMKTGTDEGGGEYEDEEGRGHNDEEEYYEEAEASVSPEKTIRASEGLPNRKIYKRKALKDSRRKKTSKEKNESLASNTTIFDYELTLENAPVEYDVKSKKSPLNEGISKKKIVARKGSKIWDHWGEWSPCSKTCGIGRTSRWRHCIGGGCAQGEKEALIKKCTNPACR